MRTVHQVIESNHDEILRLWLAGVGRSAFAEDLTSSELTGLMPAFLDSLGGTAPIDPSQMSDGQGVLLERHLSNRLRQGATLNEILTEFSLLSRCLAEVFDQEVAGARPSSRDAARLFTELHHACVASIRIFNEHLLEDEQTLKRYLRHLQRITADGGDLRRDGDPTKSRVKQAVELIMEAMGADTAALLLFEAATNTLVLSASAGDADEAVEHYVSSLGPSSLGGVIAANDRTATTLEDVEFAELEVSDALRQSGIHSLLGVRLSSRHTLRGVLYVGVRERRSFLPSEVRLIESLGEALTTHLDHARVCAALRGKAEEATAACVQRDSFVSGLVEDLARPLAVARVCAAELAHPTGDDAQSGPRNIARIGIELAHMGEMVADLMDAERVRTGQRLRMDIEGCDLSALARETTRGLCAVFGDRFIVNADTEVRGMWSADQLRRAIWNLASNAVRFGSGEDPILISVRRTGAGAEIAVHNDGGVIPIEEQAVLFHPFTVPGARPAHPPGWGIGLALVWACADAHGGQVDIASAPGEGTTFTISIPYDARPYAV